MKSSEDRFGDQAYYAELRAHLELPEVARAFFAFLMGRQLKQEYEQRGFRKTFPAA